MAIRRTWMQNIVPWPRFDRKIGCVRVRYRGSILGLVAAGKCGLEESPNCNEFLDVSREKLLAGGSQQP